MKLFGLVTTLVLAAGSQAASNVSVNIDGVSYSCTPGGGGGGGSPVKVLRVHDNSYCLGKSVEGIFTAVSSIADYQHNRRECENMVTQVMANFSGGYVWTYSVNGVCQSYLPNASTEVWTNPTVAQQYCLNLVELALKVP